MLLRIVYRSTGTPCFVLTKVARLTFAFEVWLLEHPAWQGVRREVETMFVTRDWFELLVAQTLVADALVYALFYGHFDRAFAKQNGPALAALLDFLVKWQDETARWVDACVKTAAAESAENRALIAGWATKWRAGIRIARSPVKSRRAIRSRTTP